MWLVEQEQENNKIKSKRIRELEAEVAKLEAREGVQRTLTAEYKRTAFELEAEVARLRRENGYMRQFIYRQAKGIPDPNSAYSVMKTLEAGNDK